MLDILSRWIQEASPLPWDGDHLTPGREAGRSGHIDIRLGVLPEELGRNGCCRGFGWGTGGERRPWGFKMASRDSLGGGCFFT